MKISREMLWTSGWSLLIIAAITKGGGWLLLIVVTLNFLIALFRKED